MAPSDLTVDNEHDPESGVGLSDAKFSQSRRQMLDLVNRLQSTGVQVDIDLPQIAVIGSQSAGKSSLIESISGITLPRAAGTCTRCPTECRLSRGTAPWKCKVTLRFITDPSGRALGQAHNEDFGEVIEDKARVEERIRRAQRAILNPSLPRTQFLDGVDEDLDQSELSFSSNVVCLAISGPGVADLSFCDLPGLIASVSGSRGGTGDIALVESLVTSYIKKPSCIILLTVACETDFENQGAHRLAKIHDPDGKRTIGVLTKPDRIPAGEERGWIGFIRNEREPLENNWYCVKQPSSAELKGGITWKGARQREDQFFNITPPWCELDSIHQKYLRTRNLVDRLSSILSDLISKRLPEIQEELERGIMATRLALDRLPPPPSNDPVGDIASLLHAFTADLRRHVDGVPDRKGLLQRIRPAQRNFRRAIRATAPRFMPFERAKAEKCFLTKPDFLDDEEEPVAPVEEALDISDDEDSDSDSEQQEPQVNEVYEVYEYDPRVLAWEDGANVDGARNKKIYIDQVFERATHARTRELPGNYPFVVQQTYITEIVAKWRTPALSYVQTVQTTLSEYVKKLVSIHFGDFGQGALEGRIRTLIQNHLRDCFERTESRIEWFMNLEALPFTLNEHYLSDYKKKFLAFYTSARQKDTQQHLSNLFKVFHTGEQQFGRVAVVPPAPTGIPKVLSGLTEMGVHGIKPEDIYKILPADRMAPAINIMADVRAYFQVAYKRFADNIALATDYELVRGIERDALKVLSTRLGINGPDGQRIAKEFAQESSQVADKRLDLEKKLERLQVASQELMEIGLA